jgi:hypothetical protein
MPAYGLARVSQLIDATGAHQTARGRLRHTDGSDDPTAAS